jgi:hypothetical protein
MSHARTQIRTAVAAALEGLTAAPRVYVTRLLTLPESALPCLLVNTDAEEIVGADIGNVQERRLTLTIRCVDKLLDGIDDGLDDMIAEVETRLAGNMLNGLIAANFLDALRIEYDESDCAVGIAEMQYRLTYFTTAGSPGVTL